MDSKFLNARSPMRLLEKGLHGGLGKGHLGLVLAGHGVGKSSFLVGVALDDLLRDQGVLHVALDQTVAHTRAYYDTVFDDFAAHGHLDDEVVVRARVDGLRRIRAYPSRGFGASKLAEAVKLEAESGCEPHLVILEGFDIVDASAADLQELRSLAAERQFELWLSVACDQEKIQELPAEFGKDRSSFDVILCMEPGGDRVVLRALKDHDNPDVEDLHVALDPKTHLLKRH